MTFRIGYFRTAPNVLFLVRDRADGDVDIRTADGAERTCPAAFWRVEGVDAPGLLALAAEALAVLGSTTTRHARGSVIEDAAWRCVEAHDDEGVQDCCVAAETCGQRCVACGTRREMLVKSYREAQERAREVRARLLAHLAAAPRGAQADGSFVTLRSRWPSRARTVELHAPNRRGVLARAVYSPDRYEPGQGLVTLVAPASAWTQRQADRAASRRSHAEYMQRLDEAAEALRLVYAESDARRRSPELSGILLADGQNGGTVRLSRWPANVYVSRPGALRRAGLAPYETLRQGGDVPDLDAIRRHEAAGAQWFASGLDFRFAALWLAVDQAHQVWMLGGVKSFWTYEDFAATYRGARFWRVLRDGTIAAGPP